MRESERPEGERAEGVNTSAVHKQLRELLSSDEAQGKATLPPHKRYARRAIRRRKSSTYIPRVSIPCKADE